MNPRDIILATVRKNLPQPKVPLPALSETNEKGSTTRTGYKQLLNIMPGVQKLPHSGESLVPYFRRELEGMGGRSFEVASAAAAQAKIAELFPTAKVVCSAVSEVPGTSRVQDFSDPHTLNNVDVGVVRSPLGVAEAVPRWLVFRSLRPSVPFFFGGQPALPLHWYSSNESVSALFHWDGALGHGARPGLHERRRTEPAG